MEKTVKQLKQEAHENGGVFETYDEKFNKRRRAEKVRAIKHLVGIDRRKYSIQNVEAHRELGVFIPHEIKGLLLVMATLLETKSQGSVVNRNYERLGISEIAEKVGKHRNHISPLLDRMTNEFGLAKEYSEGKSKVYELNKDIYACGKQKGAVDFVRIYQAEMLNVSKQFNLAELGFLSDLLNYMHPKHHILLTNPREVHEIDMEILRPKDIATDLNMDSATVSKYIRKLIQKKVLIRMEVGTGRSIAKVMIVSPTFFSKTSEIVDIKIIESIVNETTLSKRNYRK
ncbi:hypothetical protein [Bacillus albus]|uniref:Uncharacterized protein n=1 Tax=Bacillus albus TaxID=2026189 RepID=A0A1J9UI15_9BACI|nr:hypothetical protein [Bacillus albus]OJD68939.1 hypothetical protein BAU25_05045 [Bacillus albus]WJE70012.1 hypothetical protein QRY64_25310 [Bacillus albus]